MPRRTPPPKTIQLNVLLDAPTDEMLGALTNQTGTTKAVVVRAAIVAAYTHSIAGHPVCANGRACFVPHLHAHHAPPPPPHVAHPAPQPAPMPSAQTLPGVMPDANPQPR